MYILHFQLCFIILVYTCSNRWECKHKSCDADMASKSHVMCLAFRWCEQCRWEWGWKIWCSGWRCWGGEWRWDFWWHAATCRLRCWSEIRCGVHRWLQQWNQRSRNRGRCNARGHVWCREGSWWKQFGAWGGHWAMCRSWRKGGRFCKPATSRPGEEVPFVRRVEEVGGFVWEGWFPIYAPARHCGMFHSSAPLGILLVGKVPWWAMAYLQVGPGERRILSVASNCQAHCQVAHQGSAIGFWPVEGPSRRDEPHWSFKCLKVSCHVRCDIFIFILYIYI